MKSPGYGLRKKTTRGNKWMMNTRTNSWGGGFFKGKLKLQNHSSFSPAVSLYFSAIDHQNIGIMAALVRAPLSQCINIALTQERNDRIFLLLPCTNREVHMLMKSQNPDTKHFFFFYFNIKYLQCDITTTRLIELFLSTSWDISTFYDIF